MERPRFRPQALHWQCSWYWRALSCTALNVGACLIRLRMALKKLKELKELDAQSAYLSWKTISVAFWCVLLHLLVLRSIKAALIAQTEIILPFMINPKEKDLENSIHFPSFSILLIRMNEYARPPTEIALVLLTFYARSVSCTWTQIRWRR